MKPKISIALCAIILIVGCRKKNSETIDETTIITTQAKVQESNSSKDIKTCNDFLDRYEEWMNNYIEMMDKYKEDPIGLVSSPEYTNTMMEGLDWATQWSQKHASCALNKKFAKRMEKIQERSEKKLKALGLKN